MSYIYIVIIEESGGKVKKRFRIVDIRFVNVTAHASIPDAALTERFKGKTFSRSLQAALKALRLTSLIRI